MNVLYLLIPIALLLLILAVKILMWAVRSGQYDDLDTEGKRILFDEEPNATREPDASHSNSEKTPKHD